MMYTRGGMHSIVVHRQTSGRVLLTVCQVFDRIELYSQNSSLCSMFVVSVDLLLAACCGVETVATVRLKIPPVWCNGWGSW